MLTVEYLATRQGAGVVHRDRVARLDGRSGADLDVDDLGVLRPQIGDHDGEQRYQDQHSPERQPEPVCVSQLPST